MMISNEPTGHQYLRTFPTVHCKFSGFPQRSHYQLNFLQNIIFHEDFNRIRIHYSTIAATSSNFLIFTTFVENVFFNFPVASTQISLRFRTDTSNTDQSSHSSRQRILKALPIYKEFFFRGISFQGNLFSRIFFSRNFFSEKFSLKNTK
jgi:hypothetical protein